MATITNTVKFVTNVEELREQLKRGEDQIIATRASATKLVESLGGDRLIAAAHRYAAAVSEIGGAAKLTTAEQSRVNDVVEKALAKYQALGQQAPAALKELAAATRGVSAESQAIGKLAESLGGRDSIASAQRYAAAVQQVGGAAQLTRAEQEQVNKAVSDAIAKYQALGQVAPKALTDLAEATKRPGTAWQQFVGEFNVKEAIENPLGTAKEAVGAFAETLGPAGVAAAAAAASIAAVGVATFELAERAAKVGTELDDLADKTGLSVPALSKLSNAAQVAGSDLGTMTSALFKFEQGLGEGTKQFADGLQRLGLSVEEVKRTSPDEWLQLIADRLSGIEDPAERAAAVMQLFGKQGRDLLPVLLDLHKGFALTDDIEPWTEEQAKQAEQFEMQMKAAKIHAESFALALGRDLIPAINALTGPVKWLAGTVWVQTGLPTMFHAIGEAISWTTTTVDVLLGRVQALPEVTGDAARTVKAWKAALNERGAGPITLSPDAQKAAEQDLNETLKERQRIQKAARDDAEKQLEAWHNLTGASLALDGAVEQEVRSWLALGKSQSDIATAYGLTAKQVEAVATQMKFEQSVVEATNKAFQRQTALLTPLTAAYGSQHDAIGNVAGSWNEFHDGITVAGDEMATVTIPMFSTLPNVVPQATKAIRDATAAGRTFGETLSTTMEGLPNLLAQAFTGGGGVTGAVKALGTKLTEGLFSTKEGEEGPLAGAAKAATGGLTHLFGKTIGGALGAAIPGIGALIGPGLEALVGGFRKLFGGPSAEELKGRDTIHAFEQQIGGMLTATQKLEAGNDGWKQTTIAVRDAYLATGRSEAEAEAAVKRLWESSKKGAAETQAAIDAVNGVLNEQKQDQQDLEAAIQRYGFSIDQLGPALQKQKLHDQAQQLLNDWRLLVGSGIDIATVDAKMAGSINDYLKLARQTGQEVPVAMKPILQTMLDNGQLTDDAGNAITDMGQLGVSWAESMTQGFDRVVNKLEELLQRLGLVPRALDNLPTTVPVLEPVSGPGAEPVARGGLVTARGIQAFGWGGIVKPGWSAPWAFAPKGTDTVPAMLTPGELILNQGQQAQIASLLEQGVQVANGVIAGGKQAGAVMQDVLNVTFNISAVDASGIDEVCEKQVMPRLTSMIEDRRRGYTARWQQALGTT